jgi:iron complex transport system substrate-binding protein
MKSTFDTIKAEGIAGEDKTVYFEVSPLEYGLWTAGADTFMDEVAEMVGLKNAFSDISGWAEISQEQVIDRDPDYIVAVPMSYDESATLKDQILSRKGWQDMKAVKNGTVYIANSDEITRPGPRLAKAALELHDFLYGDNQ